MDAIYKKIETYLKKEFPKKQIIKLDHRAEVNAALAEYYGTGGILVIVYPEEDKIYYQFNRKNNE